MVFSGGEVGEIKDVITMRVHWWKLKEQFTFHLTMIYSIIPYLLGMAVTMKDAPI